MKLDNYPIAKILFPYILGIVIAYKSDFQGAAMNILLICGILASIASYILALSKSYRFEFVKFILIGISFATAGMIQTNRKFPSRCGGEDYNGVFLVRLLSDKSTSKKSSKYEAEILMFNDSSAKAGRVLLYFKSEEKSVSLTYGDIVVVRATLSNLKPPNNPGAFNYAAYMRRRGICYTAFVKEGDFELLGHNPENRIIEIAQKTRKRCVSLYEDAGMTGDELEILKAILLGDDDTLDPQLKKSYSSAGVSHILCVSGMHVGIIFMIINYLLKPLEYSRGTKLFKSTIIIAIIWAYAHVTGLAPSVTRSATMFTFVALGQILRRNTNVFHSLFASMFILLIKNPLILFEAGFQLSYLAVFGIVLFQPKISGILKLRSRVARYFWELLTVSVSAQIGTSPIAIFYFSQFPNYFMISNLCVVSLSFLVVITGVLLLPLSMFPQIGTILSSVLTYEIKAMNGIISFIGRLPFSVTENIDYNIFQVSILYLGIGLGSAYIYSKKKRIFAAMGICLAIFSISFPVKKIVSNKKGGFTAYHIRGCTALGFYSNGTCFILSDSIKNEKDKIYEYNIANHIRKKLLKAEIINIDTSLYQNNQIIKIGNHIMFLDKSYLVVDKKIKKEYADMGKIETDCIIIRGNPRILPEDLGNIATFKEAVADGSNSSYTIELWEKYCEDRGIQMYATRERTYE